MVLSRPVGAGTPRVTCGHHLASIPPTRPGVDRARPPRVGSGCPVIHSRRPMEEIPVSRPPRRYRRTSLVAAVALAIAGCTLIAGSASADPVEQVKNGSFDSGLAPWWWTGNLAPTLDNGQMCV